MTPAASEDQARYESAVRTCNIASLELLLVLVCASLGSIATYTCKLSRSLQGYLRLPKESESLPWLVCKSM